MKSIPDGIAQHKGSSQPEVAQAGQQRAETAIQPAEQVPEVEVVKFDVNNGERPFSEQKANIMLTGQLS